MFRAGQEYSEILLVTQHCTRNIQISCTKFFNCLYVPSGDYTLNIPDYELDWQRILGAILEIVLLAPPEYGSFDGEGAHYLPSIPDVLCNISNKYELKS